MEEIYIVKLKGLPPPTATSQESLSKDRSTSFYYQTDLTAEAIRGFSYLHIFFGLTVLCLSVTNLCFHENPLLLQPPLGISVWCSLAFIILGLFGIVTAHKRKNDLSRSILYAKVHFAIIIVVLSLTFTFIILFAFDLHGPIANQFIGLNIFFSVIVETAILLLTLFTCGRVLWPGCLNFCAKDWPMQPNLKRKVIVKTNVFAGAIQQDENGVVQSVGPNCVISLNMPPMASSSSSSSSSSSEQSEQSTPTINPRTHCTSSSSSLILPTYGNDSSVRDTIPTMLSINSDLTKSSNSLYSIPNNEMFLSSHATIGASHSYPLGTCSAIGSTNMLTFPSDPRNRNNYPSYDSTNYNRLHQQLYQHKAELNSSLNMNKRQLRKRSVDRSSSEDVDPYDTDEFDYCTTEDEADGNDRNLISAQSSNDEGNIRLECNDNKSLTNSSRLSPCQSDEESNETPVDHTTTTNIDINEYKYQYTLENIDLNDEKQPNDQFANPSAHSDHQMPNEKVNNDLNSTINIDDDDMNMSSTSNSENGEKDDERDEGISSSGSSTCSGELTSRSLSNRFNRMRLQTYKTNQPYKSSIKVEATESVPMDYTIKKDNASNRYQCTSINDNNKTNINNKNSAATIRLLSTKSVTNHNTYEHDRQSNHNRSEFKNDSNSCSNIPNQLSSHPYLCRMRTTNIDYFQRRYPKSEANTLLKDHIDFGISDKTNTTNVVNETERIADIERV